MRRSALAILIVTGPLLLAVVGFWWTRQRVDHRPVDIPASGPLTIALAGDVLLTSPLGSILRDAEFIAVHDEVRAAHFAVANLEMNLLGSEQALQADARPAPRWPYGSALEAEALKYLGFDAVSLANDHAADYGAEATASTIRILDGAGLLHAGTGFDLTSARAPVFAGPPSLEIATPQPAAGRASGRIAFLSAATSSFPDARATLGRSDIAGRPGLSPLRYAADITVDAATFHTLKESIAALNAGHLRSEGELIMFGTPIKKGDRTTVEFRVDEEDQRAILEVIAAARRSSDIVIVALHSHEPANASDQPAAFVQSFARAAIDAGASIIVGHGPHRIRAVETYKDGVILYSLGNFLYQTSDLDFRSANMYDAGADLYQAAVGAAGRVGAAAEPPGELGWWEGLVASATFEGGRLVEVRLRPLDLENAKSPGQKGMPRLAHGEAARSILGRLAALSGSSGTVIEIEAEQGLVRGGSPNRNGR